MRRKIAGNVSEVFWGENDLPNKCEERLELCDKRFEDMRLLIYAAFAFAAAAFIYTYTATNTLAKVDAEHMGIHLTLATKEDVTQSEQRMKDHIDLLFGVKKDKGE